MICFFCDSIIVTVVEYAKTFAREVFLLFGQFVNFIVNLLLHVLLSPGHYASHHIYKPPKLNDDTFHEAREPKTPMGIPTQEVFDLNEAGNASGNCNQFSIAMDKALKQVLKRSSISQSTSSDTSISPSVSPKCSRTVASPILTEHFHSPTQQQKQQQLQDDDFSSIQEQIEEAEDMMIQPKKRNIFIRFLTRCLFCFLFAPSLFKAPKQRRSGLKVDSYSVAQKKTSGLLEDLCVAVLLFIDKIGEAMRLFIRCRISKLFRTLVDAIKLFHPTNFLSQEGIDQRSIRELVRDEGYSYENMSVETIDGYLLRMGRIPNPKSRVAVYFQHGIMDSAHCWVANGVDLSLAFRTFDADCDIFLGNFRGLGTSLKMKNKEKPSKEYWDYSFNEHAFYDVRAFVEKIVQVKKKELGDDHFTINTVAHSLGGGSILAYLVHSKIYSYPHYLNRAILLSPSGNHQKLPWILNILSYLLKLSDWLPIHYIGLTTKTSKIFAAKVAQDINNHPATRSLLAAVLTKSIFGGDIKKNPFQFIHNLAYHTFNGTSVKLLKHLIQMQTSRKFQAYDYGEKKNLEVYGTKNPLCFTNHYDKIDIPVHIIYGSDDVVIPAECILRHYTELQKHHPELAFIKRFENIGHLDVTHGREEHVIQYILNSITRPNLRLPKPKNNSITTITKDTTKMIT